MGNLRRPENKTLSQFIVSVDLAYSKLFRRISGKEQDLIWSLDCNGNRAQHQEKLCQVFGLHDHAQKTCLFNNVKHTSTQNGSNLTFTLSLNRQDTTKKCLTISIKQDLENQLKTYYRRQTQQK